MKKAELVKAVAERTQLTKAQTEAAVNEVLAVIKETVAKGDNVALVGFGTFEKTARAGRTGRNPQTGETIEIKASKSVKFKPGKELKDAVNR